MLLLIVFWAATCLITRGQLNDGILFFLISSISNFSLCKYCLVVGLGESCPRLDGQHQDVDRAPRGRVSQKDRGQRKIGESTSIVANLRIDDG